jgi:uncharacterized protein YkwD
MRRGMSEPRRPRVASRCGLLLLAGWGSVGVAADASAQPLPAAALTCGLPNFQAASLARVNQYRASGAHCRSAGNFGPAAALRWSQPLTQAAATHAQDMKAHSFFSHTGSDGSTLAQRVNAAGYTWSAIAENIAAGQPTIQQVIDGWMRSDGHCANIMNPNLVDVGLVCVAAAPGDRRSTYWTMSLGRAR